MYVYLVFTKIQNLFEVSAHYFNLGGWVRA